MPVDRQPLHARAVGNRADRRRPRTDFLVELHRCLDDPPPRLVLRLGAGVQPVGALLLAHSVNMGDHRTVDKGESLLYDAAWMNICVH
jgi:hypothetical protein